MSSDSSNALNIAKYLKKVVDSYSKDNKMTDIYEQFRCMSEEYEKLSEEDDDVEMYSHLNLDDCDEQEQMKFLDNTASMIQCLVANSIYDRIGVVQNWKDVWMLVHDPLYKNVEKSSRKVVYSVSGNNRPIGEQSFLMWNGIQIIDIDIKRRQLAISLKSRIFKELSKYHWFLGLALSASGKSLHIWTKITPISMTQNNKRIEYLCNFRHKFSYIYIVLSKYAKELAYTKDDILQWLDMAMAKPQQGIFITSDNEAMMSTNFVDLRLDANFETAFNTGVESVDWISHPDLKDIFSKLDWFSSASNGNTKSIELSDIANINEFNKDKCIPRHYKHAQRWQIANTLTSLYGYDKALQLMTLVCKDTPYKELKGDIKTASIHDKPISIWAVKQLNKYHGFNIKVKDVDFTDEKETIENKSDNLKESPNSTIPEVRDPNVVELHMKSNMYLSDIKDDILKNLSHMTLIEAGAGYGKTEMIKAFKAKTLLILPFTSTIKAKVEKSETTKDWLYFYGAKRPSLDDLMSDCSMSMTIDKFSRLNVMELNTAAFEYIVLDESHLLFTSSYRDVMAPTIQRLANCKAKIIMMTGTPTGELLFFPNIKHIKVIKEDNRIKSFELNMCPTATERDVEMCKAMAADIVAGKKILYPTNNGNTYYEVISTLIQGFLDEIEPGRQLKSFYYKKSNYGDKSMDDINYNKSIGENDIIFCTTYLSVGVDICNDYVFSVYFNTTWIPQDLEQFANRLRNNDLYIRMYLEKIDSTGVPIPYYYTHPLDLSFSQEDLLLARDLIKTCNDMLERNNEESKYNPLIQSLLTENKYLKYDENDCKYYIDETTYKLKVFEDRYSSYQKQLPIMIAGLKYYGYTVNIQDHSEVISDEMKQVLDSTIKEKKREIWSKDTQEIFKLLDHITDGNIDVYKELIGGNYAIFKDNSEEYVESRKENNLYTDSIEIMEKNLPIILSLYKFYDIPTIKDIYKWSIEHKKSVDVNKVSYAKLMRVVKFARIERNRRKNRLDFPIMKFMKDARNFAKKNKLLSKNEIKEWLKDYAVKYANSIPDVVVNDVAFLEKIYNMVVNIWKIVIDETKTKTKNKDGQKLIAIQPYELLWETRETLKDIYSKNPTNTFFLQELVDDMKTPTTNSQPDDNELDNVDLPEFELTEKKTLDQIKPELTTVVHKGFDYNKYSDEDNSNNKFMEKMKKQNRLNANTIFDMYAELNEDEAENDTKNKVIEQDLFSESEA